MVVGISQARKQGPPVIDESDKAGHNLAPRKVSSGEAAPSPVVFQFVEWIFTITEGGPNFRTAGDERVPLL